MHGNKVNLSSRNLSHDDAENLEPRVTAEKAVVIIFHREEILMNEV